MLLEQTYASVVQIRQVKDQKSQIAERALAKVRVQLEEAEQALLDAQNQLEQYKVFRVEEKQRLYDEVQAQSGRGVYLKDFHALDHQLGTLKSKQLTYEKNLVESIEAKDKAEAAVAQAFKAWVVTQKDIDKVAAVEEPLEKSLNRALESKLEEERNEASQQKHNLTFLFRDFKNE